MGGFFEEGTLPCHRGLCSQARKERSPGSFVQVGDLSYLSWNREKKSA